MLFEEILSKSLSCPKPEKRLSELMKNSGCKFSDTYDDIITDSNVILGTIGGLPVPSEKEHILEMIQKLKDTMGRVGSLSYLSKTMADPQTAYRVIAERHGHLSICQSVSLGFWIAGVSSGSELEWTSQRDHVHLGRITHARSLIQCEPPLVCLHPDLEKMTYDIRCNLIEKLKDFDDKNPDALEARNLLFPSSKATAFFATASLGNWIKLSKYIHDSGKEKEFRNTLAKIISILKEFFPNIIP